jgi:hypothetical protein
VTGSASSPDAGRGRISPLGPLPCAAPFVFVFLDEELVFVVVFLDEELVVISERYHASYET